jgi:hypothetical protein
VVGEISRGAYLSVDDQATLSATSLALRRKPSLPRASPMLHHSNLFGVAADFLVSREQNERLE